MDGSKWPVDTLTFIRMFDYSSCLFGYGKGKRGRGFAAGLSVQKKWLPEQEVPTLHSDECLIV
jgi:hypothetical protein